MFTHTINPTILNLGPLEIRWYGLMYVLGFIITYYYVRAAIRAGKIKLTEKELDNLLGILVVALIVGARLFEVIFYEPAYYLNEPWKIFYIWQGGLSFHGGLVGLAIVGYWYARKKKIPFLKLVDVFIVPLAIGNALGRIGNFINAELYGVPTNLPWGVVFPGIEGARHPTQLYEAAYNIIIFITLFSLRNKKLKDGTLFGIFLIMYGIFRIAVEFLKDMPHYGPLTTGQYLTIPVFLLGVWLVWRNV
ncbi:prolipoprotein diacylglyceryl transferase [Candidatus Woesearchaeota archaeon]|nr:prolipoprotein diacylglyceryl transferase [Candidatus Woesearchaeota archaeon]MBW3016260.1 prolipoprotein diacylglyceryl transferase [Candidatus Woesearchaeota archaeon]